MCHRQISQSSDAMPRVGRTLLSAAFGLVQLETDRLRELSLLVVEGIKVIHGQFERRCHVQNIRCASAKLGGRPVRQLTSPFEDLFR